MVMAAPFSALDGEAIYAAVVDRGGRYLVGRLAGGAAGRTGGQLV